MCQQVWLLLLHQDTAQVMSQLVPVAPGAPLPPQGWPGPFTYPGHLELHRVSVSPVHEGGIHFGAHAQATGPIVYVQAGSTAFLETDVTDSHHHTAGSIPHGLPQHLALMPRTQPELQEYLLQRTINPR